MSGPTGPRPASGRQFELRRGTATARIGQVAAVLREFTVGGVAHTEVWADYRAYYERQYGRSLG